MKTIQEYIYEAKEYFYNKNGIVVFGGDHFIDRTFDRNISNEEIRKNIKYFIKELQEITKNESLNYECVLRNKNIHPYLNIVIKYIKFEHNKHYFVIKTIMKENNFLSHSNFIDKYA